MKNYNIMSIGEKLTDIDKSFLFGTINSIICEAAIYGAEAGSGDSYDPDPEDLLKKMNELLGYGFSNDVTIDTINHQIPTFVCNKKEEN